MLARSETSKILGFKTPAPTGPFQPSRLLRVPGVPAEYRGKNSCFRVGGNVLPGTLGTPSCLLKVRATHFKLYSTEHSCRIDSFSGTSWPLFSDLSIPFHTLFECGVSIRILTVLRTPVPVFTVNIFGSDFTVWVGREHFLNESCQLVAVMLILCGSILHRFRRFISLTLSGFFLRHWRWYSRWASRASS